MCIGLWEEGGLLQKPKEWHMAKAWYAKEERYKMKYEKQAVW